MVDITTGRAGRRGESRWFYVGMAATFVAIAFGGFVPTYWAKLAHGSFSGGPLLHWHGMLFFGWTLFFLMQTLFIATGRLVNHRNWGLVGISLATAMAISVVIAAIRTIKVAEAISMGDDARRFTIVSLTGLVVFVVFFTLAIINVRRPDWHKRCLIVATVPLMQAATARVFMTLFAPPGAVGPPPVFVAVPPGLLVDLLLVAGMVYDWRTRGRPHPAYVIGLAVNLGVQLSSVPLAGTAAWMAIARAVERLAG